MRENDNDNNLFFVCSLIEYIARKTKNTKEYIVKKLGKESINKIYALAEVYHCENIEKITDEIIKDNKIEIGNYDILKECKYKIPTFWEIGKVDQHLIMKINSDKNNKQRKIKNIPTFEAFSVDNFLTKIN